MRRVSFVGVCRKEDFEVEERGNFRLKLFNRAFCFDRLVYVCVYYVGYLVTCGFRVLGCG